MNYYQLSPTQILEELETSSEGLSDKGASSRLEKHGRNEITSQRKFSVLKIFFSQFKSPLVIILILAGIFSFLIGENVDAIIIWLAIFLDIIVGFVQEYRASNTFQSLSKSVSSKSVVIRNGKKHEINTAEIVPGDILSLKYGDKVPADARIIHQVHLEVDESALTGESMPQKKNEEKLNQETALGDRKNMLYMGTSILNGTCRAVVINTGFKTEFGKISKKVLEEKNEKTFLQQEINKFTKILTSILMIAIVIVALIGISHGDLVTDIFIESIALAVAALPESLPVVITVIFAIGMNKILKKKGLIKKLLATETLGRTEVLCIDKTGTLTQGKMEVIKIITYDEQISLDSEFQIDNKKHPLKDIKNNPLFKKIARISTIANEAFLDDDGYKGNPTDIALLKLGEEFNLTKDTIEQETPLIDFTPFNSKTKLSSYLLKNTDSQDSQNFHYVTGAPEEVLTRSKKVQKNGEIISLDDKHLSQLQKSNEDLAQEGFRIIGVAFKDTDEKESGIEDVNDMIFLGLIVISDPIRDSAKDTVRQAKKAGLKLILATGDHPNIAMNIASQVGLPCSKECVLTGKELSKLSDEEFSEHIEDYSIYARLSPSDKVRIVQAWQKKDKIVAMTGDGVNDAPALNLADIGVALGSGTDVAKEASDLVLLNDDLKTILNAIREGRGILDNIKKVVTYLISDSFAEIVIVGFTILFNLPLAITAAQLLWVNFIEDGLPDIALALEPTEDDVMRYEPKIYKRPIMDKEVKVLALLIGILGNIAMISIYLHYYTNGYEIEYVRTMVFSALSIDSLFFAFACKSLRTPIWRENLLSNKLLNFAFILGLVLFAISIYFPPIQQLLETQPIRANEWVVLLLIGFLDLFILEVIKEIFHRINFWGVD